MHRSRVGKKQTMAECNLDLPADKLCKYSYMSWCPTCDRESPRRRTKSETTHDTCGKKRREMKTFTPKKYDRRCEYENHLELDQDVPDLRFDHRVRSNLCELPTTYISNNCQLNLTHAKLSNASEFRDAKIPRDYENSYVRDCSRDCSPASERITRRLSKLRPRQHLDAHSNSPVRNYFGNERVPEAYTPEPDTCTFFDMNFDSKMLRERYSHDLEILNEKLHNLQKYHAIRPLGRIKNLDKTAKRQTTNVNLEDIRVIEDVSEPKIDGTEKYRNNDPATSTEWRKPVLRTREQKSSVKISVKASKTRFNNGRTPKLKLRKLKVNSVLMEDDSTTESEIEKLLHPNRKRIPISEIARSPPSSPEVKTLPVMPVIRPPIRVLCTPSSQDVGEMPMWPLRNSLFPNIPPYLEFSMHDGHPNRLPPGRRFLKWKLSTITPIVVRKTLVNTGFRLVRINDEFEVHTKAKLPQFFLENLSKFDLMRNFYNVQCPICTSFAESNDWTGTWGKHMKSPMFKTLKNNQKLNHFAGTFQLGRKDRLWKNVQRLMHRFGAKEFGFIPQTFILPHDLKSLKQCWECKDGSAGEKWIIKPPASARGVGIKVINKWSQLPKQTSIVVQKYIADPYLINGSKFDLRLYVLVTSFNPLRIYLYPEGLVRFASVKYSDNDKDLKDRFMHLTNYSINKMSSQYTANEDANSCQGHKWTLTKLWEYLDDRGINTEFLWDSLKELVIKTMLSGESPITQLCNENIGNRYNCYELFGIDVLFDEKLKPWLLEVNISPSLHSSSPLDLHVKGPLVQTLFNLAQFHLPPKVQRSTEVSPLCYDPRLYTTTLTPQEANKHNYFMQAEKRDDYLDYILDELNGDDVRVLTQAEDERVVQGNFERIFPTADTYVYLEFIPVRYYNRLFDAWETHYHRNREGGIALLRELCSKRIHLKVQPSPATAKSSPNTTLGAAPANSTSKGDKSPTQAKPPAKPKVLKTDTVASAQKNTN